MVQGSWWPRLVAKARGGRSLDQPHFVVAAHTETFTRFSPFFVLGSCAFCMEPQSAGWGMASALPPLQQSRKLWIFIASMGILPFDGCTEQTICLPTGAGTPWWSKDGSYVRRSRGWEWEWGKHGRWLGWHDGISTVECGWNWGTTAADIIITTTELSHEYTGCTTIAIWRTIKSGHPNACR
jgi:hypothetical protein